MSGRLWIASDHAGVKLKSFLKERSPDCFWEDLGAYDEEPVDYPDYAKSLCYQVLAHPETLGVLICGSGIGMSIAANRIPGIRACVVENPVAARLSREHNHANVLCLGARFLAPYYALEIFQIWRKTPFGKDKKHLHRIEKLENL
jgi:ribose 5-phosphate isomerase B